MCDCKKHIGVNNDCLNLYDEYCDKLERNNLLRSIKSSTNNIKGAIDFSSNDYLCLSKHRCVIDAGYFAAQKYGAGSTGARLLSGNYELLEELENTISIDKKTQQSIIFNSGYQANLSVLSALCDAKATIHKPIVIFDKLNHASLYHAVKMSEAQLIRYKHNDMNHLSCILEKHKYDNRQKIIVAETTYGMDGDCCDIHLLASFAQKYNTLLYLDEAHSTGVLGRNGLGLSSLIDISDQIVIMGTFSKAVGASGAYVACSERLKRYLVQAAGGFVYSTAPSPFIIGAAQKAWNILKTMDQERAWIIQYASEVKNAFVNQIVKSCEGACNAINTNIVSIRMDSSRKAVEIQEKLAKVGMITSAIRPPTSPVPRIRIAINAGHKECEVKKLISSIKDAL